MSTERRGVEPMDGKATCTKAFRYAGKLYHPGDNITDLPEPVLERAIGRKYCRIKESDAPRIYRRPKKRGRKRISPEETRKRIFELVRDQKYSMKIRMMRGKLVLIARKKINSKWRYRYIAPYDQVTDDIVREIIREGEARRRPASSEQQSQKNSLPSKTLP